MTLSFLADMPVSSDTVSALRNLGYDVIHARDLGLHRADDEEILQEAAEQGRVVLTTDLDFGTLLALSGKVCPGVIIFRLPFSTPQQVTNSLLAALDALSEDQVLRHIVIIEEKLVRSRPLPIDVQNRRRR